MEAIAKTRHLKGSPRKARLVIDLIRGRNVSQALNILKFTDKRAAEPITKTLRSAIANATYLAEQQNIAIDPDDLFVKTCFVDMGAHKNRRRMRPAPQGRAFREQRHYCHITILVSSDVPLAKDEDVTRKKGKKLLAKEAQSAEANMKVSAQPKAEKKTVKADKIKEEGVLATTAAVTAIPVVIEETKSAKAETVETEKPIEVPAVEEAKPENLQTETAEKPAETETVKAEELQVAEETATPKVEEAVKATPEAVQTPETLIEVETPKVEESKSEEVVEAKTAEPKKEDAAETVKSEVSAADDVVELPKADAEAKIEKQKAEASDAKNVQSQTAAERNETKKADNAQLDENDILELQ